MSRVAAVRVGVLALQGASAAHVNACARLGVEAREVRAPRELDGLTHLVLPGGESTTLHHLLTLFELWEPLRERHRAGELALFGTCAGAILLSRGCGGKPPTLGLLEAEVERNAYGRQVDSFTRVLELADEPGPSAGLTGVFIRAPRFVRVDPALHVLARLDGEPVALETPGLLATTFHPELTAETHFHRRFLALRAAAV
ncbi:MAG: pyridoxal 5'-phosphate synthase glutaminase subunit PdxT [Planctomycetes bacterium]|nr:pyridoxal 5'-phosphate synthase glutaminase subunit PdxT [Planctomycetota bacterium]